MAPENGGTEKGLLPFQGGTLIEHMIIRLRPQVASLLISANRNLDRYRTLGLPVLPDSLADHPGPLAGVHAGALHCPTPWLLAVPCDAPFVAMNLAAKLAAAANQAGTRVAVARCDGRTHWAHLLAHRSVAASIATFVTRGGRRVEEWCALQGCAVADFEDPEAFVNFNTPEDLKARS